MADESDRNQARKRDELMWIRDASDYSHRGEHRGDRKGERDRAPVVGSPSVWIVVISGSMKKRK